MGNSAAALKMCALYVRFNATCTMASSIKIFTYSKDTQTLMFELDVKHLETALTVVDEI